MEWLRKLGVRHLRTGISWADWYRENSELWFDRQMGALAEFDTTMTLCFTPEHLGVAPHYTSPPKNAGDFADFAAWAVSRYAPRRGRAEQHRGTGRGRRPDGTRQPRYGAQRMSNEQADSGNRRRRIRRIAYGGRAGARRTQGPRL